MRNTYKQNSRAVAFELLLAVEVDGAYANLLLPKLLKQAKLEQRDSALAQELAFGTLRNQLLYDKIIEIGAKRPISEIDTRGLILLRLGCHQLLSLRTPSHAAINETVNLAKQVSSQGSAGFVNGILRRVSERDLEQWRDLLLDQTTDRISKLEIEHSHPAWIIRSLEQSLRLDGRADTIEELLRVDNEAPEVSIVSLPGFNNEQETSKMQSGPASPIGYVMSSGDPGKLLGMREGGLRVQDQGSQLAALALTKASTHNTDEKWLDMCAGPGGKAALLAALAKQMNAAFQANEISEHRAKLVSQALSKIDNSVDVFCADARTIGEDAPQSYDRILLDAPCTGLGALRRRPESRWRKKPSDIAELTKLQQELIDSAWLALKVGGVLAYVTCSPHSGETVAIVDWLQRRYGSQVSLLDAPAILKSLNPNLDLNQDRKTAQLWPHINKTDAMFIALFTKSIG